MIAYRQKIYLSFKQTNKLSSLAVEDFRILYTLMRVLPDKLKEYEALPNSNLKKIEDLFNIKIFPKFHISRKFLLENDKFKERLRIKFNQWSTNIKDKTISSRLYFLYNYMVSGHNTILPPLSFSYDKYNYYAIGNNSYIELVLKNSRVLTFGQVGCVFIILINTKNTFIAHYSTYEKYQRLLFENIKNWKSLMIKKKFQFILFLMNINII